MHIINVFKYAVQYNMTSNECQPLLKEAHLLPRSLLAARRGHPRCRRRDKNDARVLEIANESLTNRERSQGEKTKRYDIECIIIIIYNIIIVLIHV